MAASTATVNNLPGILKGSRSRFTSISYSSVEEVQTQVQVQQLPDWYWGDISGHLAVPLFGAMTLSVLEATEKILRGWKDGSFLVRDASTRVNTEFTLTVVHHQLPKRLRVSVSNGKFGLMNIFEFSSVSELISYFRDHSLSEYNKDLDVKLLFPVSKRVLASELRCALQTTRFHYWDKASYLELILKLERRNRCVIRGLKIVLKAFVSCFDSYREQIQSQKQFQQEQFLQGHTAKTANAKIRDKLIKNILHLKNQTLEFKTEIGKVRHVIKMKMGYSNLLRKDFPIMKSLLREFRVKEAALVKNFNEAKIMEGNWPLPPRTIDSIWKTPIIWLSWNPSREDANAILDGRPAGTFLVRKSKDGGRVVSICAAGGNVVHCKVWREISGIGLHPDGAYFPTIKSLVLYYHVNSLEGYHPQLQVTLKYPAFAKC